MELTGRGLELDEVEANGIAKICDAVKRLGIAGATIEGPMPTMQERTNAEQISDRIVTTFIRTGHEYAYIDETLCQQFKRIANIAMDNPKPVMIDYCTPQAFGPFQPELRAEAFEALMLTAQAHDLIRARAPVVV